MAEPLLQTAGAKDAAAIVELLLEDDIEGAWYRCAGTALSTAPTALILMASMCVSVLRRCDGEGELTTENLWDYVVERIAEGEIEALASLAE